MTKAARTVGDRTHLSNVYDVSASIDDHLANLKSTEYQNFRNVMAQQLAPGSGQPLKIKSNQVRRAAVNLEGDYVRVRELEPEATSPRPHPYPNAEMRHYRMLQGESDSPTRVVGSPDVRRSRPLRGHSSQVCEDPMSQTMNKLSV